MFYRAEFCPSASNCMDLCKGSQKLGDAGAPTLDGSLPDPWKRERDGQTEIVNQDGADAP